MARRVTVVNSSRFLVFGSIGLAVATLYFAQEVLIPLVLAVLLSFLLAPLVRYVERLRVGRIPAVLAVVAVAFSLIFLLGWVVGEQLVHLAENLPQYQDEIVAKVHRLRCKGAGLTSRLGRLGREIEKAADPSSQPATTGHTTTIVPPATSIPGVTPARPLYTVPLPSPRSPIRTLGEYLGLVLGPLGTGALVVVFTIFMLLEREDMRDRMIRLVSGGKYMVTTRALNDAGKRISRYMLAQSIVNGSYGLIVAVGLWLIGLTLGGGTGFPNFVLWGLLCALLRFIPYIGPWVAATFPVVLSLAVYPGFGVFAATAALFIAVELLSNNLMEPWLYGASTGMSTVAVLAAAVFWTWLWGPVGLLVSTPLTVCIVVLGKYVPQLKFLDVLLGDQPALPPHVSYYQRLLAGDRGEAARVADEYATANGTDRMYDDVLIPALVLARRDREEAGLSAEDESSILLATGQIVHRHPGVKAPQGAGSSSPPVNVLSCPAHHKVEELVGQMLAVALHPDFTVDVVSTRALPAEVEARVAREQPALVFIAVVPPGGLEQARYLCRRLRKRFPDTRIIVGYWGRARNFDRLLVRLRTAGASYVTTSLAQSASQIRALASAPTANSEKEALPAGAGP